MELRFNYFSLRVNFSFFAVLALMLLLRDRQTALICFGSAMLHEGGHLLLLRRFGARVRRVTFGAAGVAIERADPFLLPPAKEALSALGGVAVNGLLCLCALPVRSFLSSKTFSALLCANVLLAALNLLPVYPLDLWRALHALLEARLSAERTEHLLHAISRGTAAVFCAACGVYVWKFGRNPSLLAVCVYLLLLNLKRSTSDV